MSSSLDESKNSPTTKSENSATNTPFQWPHYISSFLTLASFPPILPMKLVTEILEHLLQANGQKEFEVGQELLVKCSSFNAKGVPVFSYLD